MIMGFSLPTPVTLQLKAPELHALLISADSDGHMYSLDLLLKGKRRNK